MKLCKCTYKYKDFIGFFLNVRRVFDKSQKAYACCIYLRSVNIHGQIHVSLVCGRSRLAPMKPMSIPRLELQAA